MTGVADRTMPHNLEAEKSLLGAILIDNAQFAVAATLVDDLDFFRDAHRRIWNRMADLAEAGSAIDLVTLKNALGKRAELDEVGGPAYISGLTDGVPRASNVDYYAKIVKEKASLRSLIHVTKKALTSAFESDEDPRTVIAQTIQQLVTLEGSALTRQIPSHLKSFGEVMDEIKAEWAAGPPQFITMPWPDLNDLLVGGIVPGEMMILGARPGIGKTAAAGQIALKVARGDEFHAGRLVMMVSREMKRTQVGSRLIAMEGKIDAGAIRRQRMTLEQGKGAERAMERIGQLPGYITDAPTSIDSLREWVYACQQEVPVGLLIVDYLQLIDPPASVKDRRLQVEAVSAGLKRLTLDFNIPIIALSSLSRGADERAKPSLRSLRESGNIEHDADTVILLHRPDDTYDETDVIVAKARSGRQGEMQLLFQREFQRFVQVDRHHNEG